MNIALGGPRKMERISSDSDEFFDAAAAAASTSVQTVGTAPMARPTGMPNWRPVSNTEWPAAVAVSSDVIVPPAADATASPLSSPSRSIPDEASTARRRKLETIRNELEGRFETGPLDSSSIAADFDHDATSLASWTNRFLHRADGANVPPATASVDQRGPKRGDVVRAEDTLSTYALNKVALSPRVPDPKSEAPQSLSGSAVIPPPPMAASNLSAVRGHSTVSGIAPRRGSQQLKPPVLADVKEQDVEKGDENLDAEPRSNEIQPTPGPSDQADSSDRDPVANSIEDAGREATTSSSSKYTSASSSKSSSLPYQRRMLSVLAARPDGHKANSLDRALDGRVSVATGSPVAGATSGRKTSSLNRDSALLSYEVATNSFNTATSPGIQSYFSFDNGQESLMRHTEAAMVIDQLTIGMGDNAKTDAQQSTGEHEQHHAAEQRVVQESVCDSGTGESVPIGTAQADLARRASQPDIVAAHCVQHRKPPAPNSPPLREPVSTSTPAGGAQTSPVPPPRRKKRHVKPAAPEEKPCSSDQTPAAPLKLQTSNAPHPPRPPQRPPPLPPTPPDTLKSCRDEKQLRPSKSMCEHSSMAHSSAMHDSNAMYATAVSTLPSTPKDTGPGGRHYHLQSPKMDPISLQIMRRMSLKKDMELNQQHLSSAVGSGVGGAALSRVSSDSNLSSSTQLEAKFGQFHERRRQSDQDIGGLAGSNYASLARNYRRTMTRTMGKAYNKALAAASGIGSRVSHVSTATLGTVSNSVLGHRHRRRHTEFMVEEEDNSESGTNVAQSQHGGYGQSATARGQAASQTGRNERNVSPHVNIVRPRRAKKGPFDFEQLRRVQSLGGANNANKHAGSVWCVRWSHCGRLLATAGQDNLIRVWVLKAHHAYFAAMRSKYGAVESVAADSAFRTMNITVEHKQQHHGHQKHQSQGAARAATASPPAARSDRARRGSPDSLVACGESATGGSPVPPAAGKKAASLRRNAWAPFSDAPFCVLRAHTADVLDLSWSSNYFLLSSGMDRTVRLWHVSRNECLCVFQHVDFVPSIAFLPKDDRFFMSASLDGKLRLWHIPDKKVALWNEIDQGALVTAMAVVKNGKFVAVGTFDGRVIFYSTEQLKYHTSIEVRSTRGKNARGHKVTGLCVSGDRLLVTTNDSRVRLYDLRDLQQTCKYKGATNYSSQIKAAFSPSGKSIVCGSEDRFIYIWRTQLDSELFPVRKDRNEMWERVRSHSATVTATVFAPKPELIFEQIRDYENAAAPESGDNDSAEIEGGHPRLSVISSMHVTPLFRPPKLSSTSITTTTTTKTTIPGAVSATLATSSAAVVTSGLVGSKEQYSGDVLVSTDIAGNCYVFVNPPVVKMCHGSRFFH